MTTLVFGATGQVAQELSRLEGMTCVGRAQADLTDADACVDLIAQTKPKAVINAAAYTAVDSAENEEPLATQINGAAPAAMARACAAHDIPFVHISTDYVFDGSGSTPWSVDDQVAPLGAYGRSKLAGEVGVRDAGGTHAILRTSWVVSAHGNNFVKTMLRLGADRDALNIVADQIGGPTPARAIAKACESIAQQLRTDPAKTGTYHFSGREDVSWADFARNIFQQAQLSCKVSDIPSSDYPTPAKRPLNSRMDCGTTSATFGIERPNWRDGVADILRDL